METFSFPEKGSVEHDALFKGHANSSIDAHGHKSSGMDNDEAGDRRRRKSLSSRDVGGKSSHSPLDCGDSPTIEIAGVISTEGASVGAGGSSAQQPSSNSNDGAGIGAGGSSLPLPNSNSGIGAGASAQQPNSNSDVVLNIDDGKSKSAENDDRELSRQVSTMSIVTSSGEMLCAVCLDEFECGAICKKLPACGHIFHGMSKFC